MSEKIKKGTIMKDIQGRPLSPNVSRMLTKMFSGGKKKTYMTQNKSPKTNTKQLSNKDWDTIHKNSEEYAKMIRRNAKGN